MTKSKLIELIYRILPHSDQISDLDIDSELDAIRLSWRGNRFRITTLLHVDECQGAGDCMLAGSNLAILFAAYLNRSFAAEPK